MRLVSVVIAGLLGGAPLVAWAQSESPDARLPAGLPPELSDQRPEETGGLPEKEVLTIDELVDNLVLSASNREESALTAPAWVLTLTQEDLVERGYAELSDLLDDLPGMDVIRAYGDTYFRSYWRGYRSLIGAPYLLLLDGIEFNHLYLNEGEIMAAFPIAAVERVEIVFGPASVVYGPNAAMGVINVITRARQRDEIETEMSARFFLRVPTNADLAFSNASKVADVFARWQGRGIQVSLAARFDSMVLDPSLSNRFEYLSNRYYEERRFYGEFLDRNQLAGPFRSTNDKVGIDGRIQLEGFEIGFQRYRMRGSNGLVYAADRAPNRIPYVTLEQSVFLRYRYEYSHVFSSSTMLRFRESHIDTPTAWLEYFHPAQRVTFQYWLSTNFAYVASQDFSWSVFEGKITDEDELILDFGARYERRDLERDYIRNGESFWDPSLPLTPSQPGGPAYVFPEPNAPQRQIANRDDVDTFGIYALARYRIVSGHYLNLGARIDYNSFFDEVSPLFRGGYVGQIIPELTIKLLYGQAIRDPNRRVLFGGFSASGSNLDLERERSQTVELSISYRLDWLALQSNIWFVEVSNGFVSASGLPDNVGQRLLFGGDFSAVALFDIPPLRQLKLWLYYSPYFVAEEEVTSTDGTSMMQPIGDLANHKVFGGATIDFHRMASMTILGRCISDRETVPSNPIRSVPGYCTLDANIIFRDFAIDGIWFSMRMTNLLGTEYAHPGVGPADTGDTPGRWQGEQWIGSDGYFNSLLPQPGRALSFRLGLDF